MGHQKLVQRSPTRLPGPSRPAAGSGGASVHVVGAGGIVFTKGVKHSHAPSGRWADIQAAPCTSDTMVAYACSALSPSLLVDAAVVAEFKLKPIAYKHLQWYLVDGYGADFVEDDNIRIL